MESGSETKRARASNRNAFGGVLVGLGLLLALMGFFAGMSAGGLGGLKVFKGFLIPAGVSFALGVINLLRIPPLVLVALGLPIASLGVFGVFDDCPGAHSSCADRMGLGHGPNAAAFISGCVLIGFGVVMLLWRVRRRSNQDEESTASVS